MNPSAAFRVCALPAESFSELFSLSDEALAARGAQRRIVDATPGSPCRVSLEDADRGETVIALSYAHHPVAGPYSGSGPIFVRPHACQAEFSIDEIPDLLRDRQLSIRAYGPTGLMNDASVVPGRDLKAEIKRMFEEGSNAYLPVHNAGPGCYLCSVERAHKPAVPPV